ncbi:MAG TPA: hypothetical protein VMH88_09415 [Gemmatimonadales bacterium]|nr:hypothetical protein [Gemmatimonadales bacterium]
MAKEKERDWDKELKEVDKLLNQLPTYREEQAATKAAQARSAAVPPAAHGAADPGLSTRAWIGTWARVGLGLLVGIGMTQWPYTHGCGLKLYFYLGGVAVVLVAGLWSSVSSWRRRLSFAHILSQGLIIWALVLAAREILPRVHYARETATWFCP